MHTTTASKQASWFTNTSTQRQQQQHPEYLKVAVDEGAHIALVISDLKFPSQEIASNGRHLALVHIQVIIASQRVPATVYV